MCIYSTMNNINHYLRKIYRHDRSNLQTALHNIFSVDRTVSPVALETCVKLQQVGTKPLCSTFKEKDNF